MNNLKSALLKLTILSLTAVVIQNAAKASYQCESNSGDTSIIIKEFPMQRVGNASIEIEPKGEDSALFFGYSYFTDEDFNQKKEISFGDLGEKLTLTFQPLVCNRALCDFSAGSLITGFLKTNGPFETSYYCHETLE